MKGKRKNINKKELNDFLRYSGNDMPDSERNAFEKSLQKDPFSEEAAEGFSAFEPGQISGDLASLDKRLLRRTRRSRRMTWYRIAASVAVLMIISSVYIVLDRKGSANLSKKSFQPDTINIAGSGAIKKEANAPAPRMIEAGESKPSGRMADMNEASNEPSREEQSHVAVGGDKIPENNAVTREAEDQAAPAAAEKSDPYLKVEVLKEEDADRKKSLSVRSVQARLSTDYREPVPVTGKDSFDIYIQKNIRLPQQQHAGQDSVVTLSFVVTKGGIPSDIEILRTPGEEYSNEALRLLKEGPLWKPAIRNGVYSSEKTTIEIPFRHSD